MRKVTPGTSLLKLLLVATGRCLEVPVYCRAIAVYRFSIRPYVMKLECKLQGRLISVCTDFVYLIYRYFLVLLNILIYRCKILSTGNDTLSNGETKHYFRVATD